MALGLDTTLIFCIAIKLIYVPLSYSSMKEHNIMYSPFEIAYGLTLLCWLKNAQQVFITNIFICSNVPNCLTVEQIFIFYMPLY